MTGLLFLLFYIYILFIFNFSLYTNISIITLNFKVYFFSFIFNTFLVFYMCFFLYIWIYYSRYSRDNKKLFNTNKKKSGVSIGSARECLFFLLIKKIYLIYILLMIKRYFLFGSVLKSKKTSPTFLLLLHGHNRESVKKYQKNELMVFRIKKKLK